MLVFQDSVAGKKQELINQLAGLLRQPGNFQLLRDHQREELNTKKSTRHCDCLLPACLMEENGLQVMCCPNSSCTWKESLNETPALGLFLLLTSIHLFTRRCSSTTVGLASDCQYCHRYEFFLSVIELADQISSPPTVTPLGMLHCFVAFGSHVARFLRFCS